MKAAVMRDGRLLVDDLAEFSPQPGQVIAEVIACGICGSDLHALHHADQLVEMARVMSAEAGPFAPAPMDASRDVVMGCLLYTSPSPRDRQKSRMPSSA